MEDNKKPIETLKDNSKEEILKSQLKEYSERIKELEAINLKNEQEKERKAIFKEFMITSDKQKTISGFIEKHNIKDQRAFIEDISKLLDTSEIRKSKMADNYYNSYQEGIKDDFLQSPWFALRGDPRSSQG